MAILFMVAAAPVLLAGAISVAIFDGSPIFFWQHRIGLRGRVFRIWKLRTMRSASGPSVTAAGDPRVTRVGRILRRFKVDELPQLVNVLRGEMGVVGHRPEVPDVVARNRRVYGCLLGVRPGLSDWASLVFRDEEGLLGEHAGEPEFYETRLLARKVALARLYGRHRTLCTDCAVVLSTIASSLFGKTGLVLGLSAAMVARAHAVGVRPSVGSRRESAHR